MSEITDEKIIKIIELFCFYDSDKTCVCGKDTEMYETLHDAIIDVRKIINE